MLSAGRPSMRPRPEDRGERLALQMVLFTVVRACCASGWDVGKRHRAGQTRVHLLTPVGGRCSVTRAGRGPKNRVTSQLSKNYATETGRTLFQHPGVRVLDKRTTVRPQPSFGRLVASCILAVENSQISIAGRGGVRQSGLTAVAVPIWIVDDPAAYAAGSP